MSLLQELGETVDEIYKNYPPRIELRGWWWKKHIPHFKRQQEVMQKLIDYDWKNGLAERVSQEMERRLREEIRGEFMDKARFN